MEVRIGQKWKNNRNGHVYEILDLPEWSDTPDEAEALEVFVYVRNLSSGKTYTRSIHSFLGINRNGVERFTLQEGLKDGRNHAQPEDSGLRPEDRWP